MSDRRGESDRRGTGSGVSGQGLRGHHGLSVVPSDGRHWGVLSLGLAESDFYFKIKDHFICCLENKLKWGKNRKRKRSEVIPVI